MIPIIFLILFNFYVNASINNVLFIIIDDLRPELGIYGGDAITPHIDKFFSSGIVFQNSFAQMALCAPSRNSLLTSRRPDRLKLYDFYSYWRNCSGNYTTLPQYLKQSGYDTHSIGKVFHPGASSNFSDDFPNSWSVPPWHPPSEQYKDAPVCYSNGGWHTNIVCPVRLQEQPGNTLPDIEIADEAVAYLKSRKYVKRPFFLAVGFHKPHIPLKYPVKYRDLYPLEKIKLPPVRRMPPGMPDVAWNPWNDLRWRDDIKSVNASFPFGPMPDNWARLIRQSYLAAVSYVDHQIGNVLKGLRNNNLVNSTIVILLGDHGWSLGEHGEWSKYSNFDTALRVPLLFKIPNFGKGIRVPDLVELVDIFPTLVNILGLKQMPRCKDSREEFCTEGASLLPLMLGKKKKKNEAYSQYPRPGVEPSRHPDSDRPRLKQITIMGYSVRTVRHRFTLWVSWKPFTPDWSDVKGVELYDHVIDPYENLNLAGRPGLENIEEQLRHLLQDHF